MSEEKALTVDSAVRTFRDFGGKLGLDGDQVGNGSVITVTGPRDMNCEDGPHKVIPFKLGKGGSAGFILFHELSEGNQETLRGMFGGRVRLPRS